MGIVEQRIAGIPIFSQNTAEVLRVLEERLEREVQTLIATPNPEMLLLAMVDTRFAESLRRVDLRIPDGIGLILMAKLLGRPLAERVSGSDLLYPLAAIAERRHLTVILLGNDEHANLSTHHALKKAFPQLSVLSLPNIRIEHREHGWSMPNEVKEAIHDAGLCVIMAGLGMQKQEEWMLEHLRTLSNVKIAIGCGGAFAMIGGTLPRAPRWMRHCGLEWLWRLWLEPKRLGRILRAVFVFPVRLLVYEMRKTK